MRLFKPFVATQILTLVSCCICFLAGMRYSQTSSRLDEQSDKFVFQFQELETTRAESRRAYLPFLKQKTLDCGLYCLDAGAKDGQLPHTKDEVYYVESGVAKINIGGTDYDLKPGSIVFVPAYEKHHFHSIKEDLKTLVFFSRFPVESPDNQDSNAERDKKLRSSVTSAMRFMATMDSVTDANLSDGPGWVQNSENINRKSHQMGMTKSARIAKGKGLSEDCLQFTEKSKQVLFYRATEDCGLSPGKNWSGSVSFFLKVDPNKDLGDGYCDPIQIAGRKWNDGAIWCDFDNVKPRTFRMGVFSDSAFWNPLGKKHEEFAPADLPIITVKNPPFNSKEWTHVVMTFEGINRTDGKKGNAKLYLNGKLQGELNREFKISWHKDDPIAAVMLGLNYIGYFDELTVYDRTLTAEEINFLNRSTRNQ